MPVITISRQTGSGGASIGHRLARQLGAVYLNQQIIREVAQRLGLPEEVAASHDERADAFLERLGRLFWIADAGYIPYGPPSDLNPFESTTDAYVQAVRELILETARSDNAVIFGHGAQFVLAQRVEVLHVRFVAPLAFRVDRVMRRDRVEWTEARRRVRTEDERRAHHIRQYYHADWNAPDPFHLILNTARLDSEACIRLILSASQALQTPEGFEARSKRDDACSTEG